MDKIYIDYGKRINSAILNVVREILKDLSNSKYLLTIVFILLLKQSLTVSKYPQNF